MPRLRTRLAAGLTLALLALPLLGVDLPRYGRHPLDEVALGASASMRHVAAVIEGGEALTMVDLLRGSPRFTGPPNPTALFEQQQAQHAALPPLDNPLELRLLTLNTALLDRTYLFGSRVQMPNIPARKPEQLRRLLDGRWDILFLQEVWEWADVQAFAAAAEAAGYAWYAGSERHHVQHGLMIVVRRSLIGEGAQDHHEQQFKARRRIERWPGPNIKRGWLEWEFTLAATGRRVRLFDTHPQAFPSFWQVRIGQARELGLAVAEADADALVLLGGDLNGGAYYPHDTFGLYKDEAVSGWWANASSLPALFHYGALTDMQTVVGKAHDVARMDALPPFDASWAQNPLGGACGSIPVDTFTGTDCNLNYAHNYIAQEYPARLDYLMFRDGRQELRVVDTQLEFTARDVPVPGGEPVELSDHYGVSAVIQIAGPPRPAAPPAAAPVEATPEAAPAP